MGPQFPPPCVMGDESIMVRCVVVGPSRLLVLSHLTLLPSAPYLQLLLLLILLLPFPSYSRQRLTVHPMSRCNKIYDGIVIGKLPIESVITSTFDACSMCCRFTRLLKVEFT